MDNLLKIPLFPLMWFMDYLPGFFRFVIAACVLFKMIRDVYHFNHGKPEGVLKHKKEEEQIDSPVPDQYGYLHYPKQFGCCPVHRIH